MGSLTKMYPSLLCFQNQRVLSLSFCAFFSVIQLELHELQHLVELTIYLHQAHEK